MAGAYNYLKNNLLTAKYGSMIAKLTNNILPHKFMVSSQDIDLTNVNNVGIIELSIDTLINFGLNTGEGLLPRL